MHQSYRMDEFLITTHTVAASIHVNSHEHRWTWAQIDIV